MAYDKVTEDTVYTCTGHPLKSDIANILDWMLNKDFTTAYKSILLIESRQDYIAQQCFFFRLKQQSELLETKSWKQFILSN